MAAVGTETILANQPLNDKQLQQDTKKANKKKKKKRRTHGNSTQESSSEVESSNERDKSEPNVEIEYVQAVDFDVKDPRYAEFAKIFEKFRLPNASDIAAAAAAEAAAAAAAAKDPDADSDEEEEGNAGNNETIEVDGQKLSKKKLRKLKRLSVAELKQLVRKPEVVEWVDVTAMDPKLLVHLKSYRNTVPVPRHWSQKRRYLQNKRGIEKPPFDLPEFIKHTGITEMREAVREKEDTMKMRQKAREKMQPKSGKLEIDYQKLHDAFFRFQTKPKMGSHGDMYYEGKEFEVHLKEKKPGNLSEELKAALGMPEGAPPPWLINMQRYGPPPSYPNLRIAGLNAPIPQGAQWGYHPGGWGRPPVDEFGNPLYGDVFGTFIAAPPAELTAPIERRVWGEMEEVEEEEEEEESEEENNVVEEKPQQPQEDGLPKPTDADGLVTPSGIMSTTTSGMETPDAIELRKDRRGDDTPSTVDEPRSLYTIIPQKETKISGFMGSQFTYDVNAGRAVKGTDDIDVTFDPSELENLDDEAVRHKYDQTLKAGKEDEAPDLSDMVAEHAAKADKKRKAKTTQDSKTNKKYKDFKF